MDLNAWLQQMMRQQQPAPQMDVLGSINLPQKAGAGGPGSPTMPQPGGRSGFSTGSVPGIATPDGGYAAGGAGAAQDPSTASNIGQLIFSKSPSSQALAMAGK